MIKIIEHGYKYHMEAKCSSCGCRFSYEWEDVLKNNFYGYNDGYYSYTIPTYKVICPECGAHITIPYFENPFKQSDTTITYTLIADENGGITSSRKDIKDEED